MELKLYLPGDDFIEFSKINSVQLTFEGYGFTIAGRKFGKKSYHTEIAESALELITWKMWNMD